MEVTDVIPVEATTAPSQDDTNPVIFISHKHEDSHIADVVATWLRRNTGGAARVYLSSSPWLDRPRVGRELTRELRKAVAAAHVVLLIYTVPDKDWNYCMWEIGIASDPSTPEAVVVVLQCGASVPTLFTNQVRVDVRNDVAIQSFASQILTDSAYFPTTGRALTQYTKDGEDIRREAKDLHEKLAPYLLDEVRNWVTRPFLRLALSRELSQRLAVNERPQDQAAVIRRAEVVEQELALDRVFGVAAKPGLTLGDLFDSWAGQHSSTTGGESQWLQDLALQMARAAQSLLLDGQMMWMPGRSPSESYAPLVMRVSDTGLRTEFDIFFCEQKVS